MEVTNLIEFNSIGFTILGVPAYIFCSLTAFVISICLFMAMLSQKGYAIDPHLKCLAISLGGLILSAKFFGCLSGIYGAVGLGSSITLETVKNTGIVFYGGLIGMLTTYYLAVKFVHDASLQTLDIVAVMVPLFHSFSRIGCFLGGCCYGKVFNGPLSIVYTTKAYGSISTENRFPVQIVESLFNLSLFFYLFKTLQCDEWKEKHILSQYLLMYSFGRFILEFFRGDTYRGIIGGISFSQVVSIGIWLYLAVVQKRKMGRKVESMK